MYNLSYQKANTCLPMAKNTRDGAYLYTRPGGNTCSLFCMSVSEACNYGTHDYVRVLSRVVQAESVSTLASKQEQQAARIRHQDCVVALFQRNHEQTSFELKENVLKLLSRAINNSMTLIITESAATASALQMLACGGSALLLVEDLLNNVCMLLSHLSQSKNKEDNILHEQLLQLISTESLPVITAYTDNFFVQAVQQLATAADKQLQQQQHSDEADCRMQQDRQTLELLKLHECAADHAAAVISTWKVLLVELHATAKKILKPDAGFAPAFSSAVHLTAISAPLLHKGLLLSTNQSQRSSSSTATSHQLATTQLEQQAGAALTTALEKLVIQSLILCQLMAMLIQSVMNVLPAFEQQASSLYKQQQQQLQQHLLLTDRLPQLLLLTVAYQVAALHAAFAEGTAAEHQQRRQRQQQGFLSSHNTIVTSLGLPPDINMLDQIIAEEYNVRVCGCAVWALSSLIDMKTKAAASSIDGSSRSSSTYAVNTAFGSRQLLHIKSLDKVFPKRLILPSVRLLVETLMLLPAHDVVTRVRSMQLVLLLLRLVATQHTGTQMLSAAAFQQAEAPPAAAAAGVAAAAKLLMPQLPAAVAAGLLQPVVQQLSRAVMQALKETEPKQQQQQQQQSARHSIPPADADQAAGRMRLLRSYGELLMTVCQSVEAKHIAAALKSDDPVTPLVAIEAVIRTYTLTPTAASHKHGQPQQEQQSKPAPAAASQYHPAENSSDSSTTHPQPAVLLLPFITKVVRAILLLIKDHQLLQQANISSASTLNTLIIRTGSLVTTACKVGTRATDQWLKYRKLQPEGGQRLRSNAGTAAATAAAAVIAMGSREATQELINWYMKAPPAVTAIASELITCVHSTSFNASSTGSSSSETATCTGPRTPNQHSKGSRAKSGTHSRKIAKQSRSSSCSAAATIASRTDAVSAAELASGCCSNFPLVMLVKMMTASVSHLSAAHECVTESAENLAKHSIGLVAASRLRKSETPASTAMLWPYAMVSTGCGTVFLALTGVMSGIALGLQNALLHHNKEGFSNSMLQPSKPGMKQHLRRLHTLQQLSERTFKGKIGRNILVRDVDGCPDLFASAPSCFAADHVGKGDGSAGSGGLPAEHARKDGNTTLGCAAAADSSQPYDQQMASMYSQLNDFVSEVLASLPVPFCCNNPSCVNLSQLSEYQLVSGKACVCGGCKVARYCSRKCQKQHWTHHKARCLQISMRTVS